MAASSKKYKCNACMHEFRLDVHPYQITDAEQSSCPKCDVVAVKFIYEKPEISVNNDALPCIGYHSQAVRPPDGFRDLMKNMKANSPGSNMNIM